MASNQAHDPDSDPARSTRPPVEDALGRLEERLDRASQAAERLLADAAQRVTAAGTRSRSNPEPGPHSDSDPDSDPAATGDGRDTPPSAGWQQPASERGPSWPLLADADLLLGLVGAVRDRIPPDLQQRLVEAVRELLLALRALIDWYLERTERTEQGSAEVQDIPIL